jgi:hypothetical protein
MELMGKHGDRAMSVIIQDMHNTFFTVFYYEDCECGSKRIERYKAITMNDKEVEKLVSFLLEGLESHNNKLEFLKSLKEARR